MAGKSTYTPVSLFWVFFVPAVVFGVVWYGYTQPGWVGGQVQRIFGPFVDPLIRFFGRVF